MNSLRALKSFWTSSKSSSTLGTSSFQVLSDLHLEVGQQYSAFDFPITAPHLILAGDIGRLSDHNAFQSFLAAQTARYKSVFLVLGNHEFYGSSHSKSLEIALKMEKEPEFNGKLTLLHRKRVDVPGSRITILGCSLWSRIPDDAKPIVKSKVNDFNRIESWSPDSHNEEHERDIQWLRDQVDDIKKENETLALNPDPHHAAQKRSILIVTHHAPCMRGTSEPRFEDSPWASAFSTDLLNGAENWPYVSAWVHGHTHYSTQLTKAGVKVVSNQRGYVLPGLKRKTPEGYGKGNWQKFDPGFVLRL